MGKIRITYPVIVFETLEIELPEEKIEEIENFGHYEKIDFTKEMITIHQPENEDWVYNLDAAFDSDFAKIKRVKDEE